MLTTRGSILRSSVRESFQSINGARTFLRQLLLLLPTNTTTAIHKATAFVVRSAESCRIRGVVHRYSIVPTVRSTDSTTLLFLHYIYLYMLWYQVATIGGTILSHFSAQVSQREQCDAHIRELSSWSHPTVEYCEECRWAERDVYKKKWIKEQNAIFIGHHRV